MTESSFKDIWHSSCVPDARQSAFRKTELRRHSMSMRDKGAEAHMEKQGTLFRTHETS